LPKVELQDKAARDAALDPSRSFIVQAPAGSGKTDLLVKRYLALLPLVEKPEEILAITFTIKAAAEMRKRVLEKIENPAAIAHRLRIQTIDALCMALTRQMPVLTRFGVQPAIVEDATHLYREAAARIFRRLDGSAEKLLKHLDNDVGRGVSLLAEVLENRDRWMRKTGAAPGRAELEKALASERKRLLDHARSLHKKASVEWAEELLTKGYEWRRQNAEAMALAGNEPLRAALEALLKQPEARYTDAQWDALEAIFALLLPSVAELRVVFAERGEADFTEFAHGALYALGSVDDPSELLLCLDSRVSHILVDEFQDTSDSQWRLLEKLTAGWQPGDGRTLFLVGDPMQSIYGFRDADVSLFLTARREGISSVSLESLTLTSNFRSQAGLVGWFNESFPRVLPAAADETFGAVPYSPATPERPPLDGGAVTWHGFFDHGSEAQRVVELLTRAKGKSAILVRNRLHLDHIVPALREAGIPFRAVEIEELGAKQVVQDLYALTRALSHLGDRVAWLALLRAPWCGLTLEDLLAVCTPREKKEDRQLSLFDAPPVEDGKGSLRRHDIVWDLLQNVAHLSADGRARAERLRAVLAPQVAGRLRGTLRERVEQAWLALGGPACAADATALGDAEIYLDELERMEEAGDADIAALEQKLEKLFALPDVGAGEDAVEVMTIHKAKGLEFDTVIVPGLERLPRGGGKGLFAWKTMPAGRLLIAPIDETGSEEGATYDHVRRLQREAEDIEAGRLFYVAATRAKERLHLLSCVKHDVGELREPSKRSLLAKVWWQARPHFGAPPAGPEEERGAPVRDVLRRLPAAFAVPAPPPAAVLHSTEEDAPRELIEFSWAGETARHVGTVVHRWLQRMAEDGLRGWDEARVDGLRTSFSEQLKQAGVPSADLSRSVERVGDALKKALQDERGRWVLGPHPEAMSEYRMRVRTARGMRTFVMDRVFRDAGGARWIVDYKTSRHEGAELDAFLDRELERYGPQLKGYREALADGKPALYFPLLGGWREWNP
jgi:ATP-dependent exoDNAse (exonuclease V) beta subunit